MTVFNIPLEDYRNRLEEGFETADEEFRVLYMGDNPSNYCDDIRNILGSMAERAGYSTGVEVHHADIDESVLNDSNADRTYEADAASLDFPDNFYDATITHHLLCDPSIEEGETVVEKRESILEETERVSRTKPIHEVC